MWWIRFSSNLTPHDGCIFLSSLIPHDWPTHGYLKNTTILCIKILIFSIIYQGINDLWNCTLYCIHLDEFEHRHIAEIVMMVLHVFIYIKCLVKKDFSFLFLLWHTITNWSLTILIVLEVRTLKSKGWQSHALSPSSYCYWQFLPFLGLLLHNSNLGLHCHMAIPSVDLCLHMVISRSLCLCLWVSIPIRNRVILD